MKSFRPMKSCGSWKILVIMSGEGTILKLDPLCALQHHCSTFISTKQLIFSSVIFLSNMLAPALLQTHFDLSNVHEFSLS